MSVPTTFKLTNPSLNKVESIEGIDEDVMIGFNGLRFNIFSKVGMEAKDVVLFRGSMIVNNPSDVPIHNTPLDA